MASRADYEAARRPAFQLIKNQPSLPRALARNGYVSLQTGKLWEGHFFNAGFTHGMTLFSPRPGQDYGGNRTLSSGKLAAHGNGDHGLQIGRETMRPIIDLLDGPARARPFFLWYAPYLPHQPHDSPRHYHDLHRQRGAPAHRIPYLAAISQFDDTVGRLLRILEERDLLATTLIVLCSDNGWTPGNRQLKKNPLEFAHTRESKSSPFEDGLRTPILLSLPGSVIPATHSPPVSSIDLLPTILDALRLPDPIPGLPGRSLWPAATGSTPLADHPVFGEIYPGDAASLRQPERHIAYRWIRDGDFKLIVPHRHDRRAPWGGYLEDIALFNLAADPGEKQNLASSLPDRVQSLRQKLDSWWNPSP